MSQKSENNNYYSHAPINAHYSVSACHVHGIRHEFLLSFKLDNS